MKIVVISILKYFGIEIPSNFSANWTKYDENFVSLCPLFYAVGPHCYPHWNLKTKYNSDFKCLNTLIAWRKVLHTNEHSTTGPHTTFLDRPVEWRQSGCHIACKSPLLKLMKLSCTGNCGLGSLGPLIAVMFTQKFKKLSIKLLFICPVVNNVLNEPWQDMKQLILL